MMEYLYNTLDQTDMKKIHTFLIYIVLAILPLIVFWKAAIVSHVFVQGANFGSDLLFLNLPFKYILADSYQHGEIPIWSSQLANGFPLLGEGQSGVFYPVNVLLAFVSPYIALNYSFLIAMIVGGCGTYLFATSLFSKSKLIGFYSAIVFMFSSFFIVRLQHLNLVVAGAYLPLLLWSIHSFFSKLDYKFALLGGTFLGLQFFAGHPPITYYCLIIASWWFIGELFFWMLKEIALRRRITAALFVRIALGVTIFFVVGSCLSMVQLLPSIEFSKMTYRSTSAGNFNWATQYSFHPKFLIGLICPFCLGNPAEGSYRFEDVYGIWWENLMFIGIVPFILAFSVILYVVYKLMVSVRLFYTISPVVFRAHVAKISSEWYYLVFLTIGFFTFLYIMLGRASLLFAALYYVIPGMNLFRIPARFNVFVILQLSLLSGVGLYWLLWWLKKRFFKNSVFFMRSLFILFVVITLYELTVFAYSYISFLPIEYFSKKPEILKSLPYPHDSYRVYPVTHFQINPYIFQGWMKNKDEIVNYQEAMPGNFTAAHGLLNFTDYGWAEGGMRILGLDKLEYSMIGTHFEINKYDSEKVASLLGLWSVKYIFSYEPFQSASYVLKGTVATHPFYKKPLMLYENRGFKPRAYFVSELRYGGTAKEIIEKLLSEPSDGSFAYTSEKPKQISPSSQTVYDGAVTDIVSKNTYTAIKTSSTSDGYLILTDSAYPGWKVYVDGLEKSIYTVNALQRGVFVPKGEHRVEWVFAPMSVYIGGPISVVTVIGLLIWALLYFKKRPYAY
jgi:hypothetical protein